MPPQDDEYHFQTAPSVLRLPPVRLRMEEDPTQITVGVAKADVGIVENGFTLIVMLTQVVELHVPSALTK